MPYFEEHKILFIHIPKNAGMYIEKVLGIPKEIVNYAQPTSKKTLYQKLRGQAVKVKSQLCANKVRKDLEKKYLYGQFAGPYIFQHASLSEIVSYRMLDKETIENSKILAVHRNPIDRAISIYKYWGLYKRVSFDDFCSGYILNPKNAIDNFGLLVHLKPQASFVDSSSGYFKRVNWISFENFNFDMNDFFIKNNIHNKLYEEKINASSNKSFDISKGSEDIIREVYSDDFELFGYQ